VSSGLLRHLAGRGHRLGCVDRSQAMSLLPAAYRQALLMRDLGLPYEAIAEALTIEPEGVPALIRLAEAKLSNLLVSRPSGQESTHSDN